MPSNHHALYINLLDIGVGDAPWPASINVPTAMAIAKDIKSRPVIRVEKIALASLLSILVVRFLLGKDTTKSEFELRFISQNPVDSYF